MSSATPSNGRSVPASAVWIDGQLVEPSEAVVSIFDHGFTVGDGVFETMKVVDGRAFALTRHLDRLHRSATGLGLSVPLSHDKLRAVVDETMQAAGPGAGRVRLTLTGGPAPLGSGRGDRGPTLVVAAGALESWEPDTVAVTVPWPRNERSAVAGLKTTSYAENVVALAEAAKLGATEAIFGNLAGNLCEGTGSNVFVQIGGRLVTPPLLSGCLAGVTRALLLEEFPGAEEDDLPLSALDEADEVLLTSSTRDVQPLRSMDGRSLPGAEGTVARQAVAAIDDLQRRNLDP
jgi:branched-chain amino acid aminotransferase